MRVANAWLWQQTPTAAGAGGATADPAACKSSPVRQSNHLKQKSSNASPVGDASLPRLIPCKNMARLINALESKP